MADEEKVVDNDFDDDYEASGTEVNVSRPGTDTNIVFQLLVGAVGTSVLALATFPLKGTAATYLYEIINERGPVQYGELFMSFMVAAIVFLKTRIVKKQLRSIAESPITPEIDLTDDEQLTALRKAVKEDEFFAWSITLNRIDRLLALWLGSKDIGRISNWITAESDRDASASDSSYSNARVLVWAIPILGFIGTVLGLGTAVSSFSKFLAGAADLGQIKEAIGDVTSGLGTAFDTTLLALVLSVFLMFPLTSVQRKEETLFVEIDNYLDDTLISRLPSAEQQPIVIENLEDSIEAAFRRYIPDPDRYDEVFTRSIEKAAVSVEERFSGLAQTYEATLKDLTGRMSQSLANVGESIEKSLAAAMTDMHDQEEKLVASRRQIAQEESERLQQLLGEVQASAVQASQQATESVLSLKSGAEEGMTKSLEAAQLIAGRMEEVSRLATGIEDLLQIQQAVEKGLSGIAAAEEFQLTLSTIRQHLASTDEFCSQLSRPRVITLEEEVS